MTATLFRREPRLEAPTAPTGELDLQEPPGMPEEPESRASSMLMYLPMAAGSGAMMLMFILPGTSGSIRYVASGLMAVSMVAMLLAGVARGMGDRKREANHERRDYLRYLAQVRTRMREAIDKQRASMTWRHPAPERLGAMVGGRRMWERATGHDDFLEVRVASGRQLPLLRPVAPQTKPLDDLEPLSAGALRRFLQRFGTVDDLPVAVQLRTYARVCVDGDADLATAVARAMVMQLATFHAPDDVRLAVCVSPDRLEEWEWAKWLPHCRHPSAVDGGGPVRMVTTDLQRLTDLLDQDELQERPGFEVGSTPDTDDWSWVVVVDGLEVPATSRLSTRGYANVTTIGVGGAFDLPSHEETLRLEAGDELVLVAEANGEDDPTPVGSPDTCSVVAARSLATRLAGFRTDGPAEGATGVTVGEVQLPTLLGIGDVRDMDPPSTWKPAISTGRLRVPIGVDEKGVPVELDIKESAQGGMGPHGMLVGATGSGKSELLRTLVLSMAASHDPATLNMVLVDFKGGATFLGLEDLPHVSAVITNLADELSLVDRMQDALHGELVRRQELLRRTGHASLLEYERARDQGADLAPLPSLFVVVDEFSELLSAKRDFLNLFVMIGRLGRSLGVHLLLATQRLEEGRIHQLEGHLSYRIGLRMFSAMESRGVLGISDAYESPLPPGGGFLKTDTATLRRFKGAYVSGVLRAAARERREPSARVLRDIVPFTTDEVAMPDDAEEQQAAEEEEREREREEEARRRGETILSVMAARMRGRGRPAHRVWLPPLEEPPSLDLLLADPSVEAPEDGPLPVDPRWRSSLNVPVGIIDKPFEQRWDLLTADLSSGKGNVGIVGGPQSGKSTLLRSLILSLGLTHTPREVQLYCLDLSGGGLAGLSRLPHVGGVASRVDRDQVIRTLAEVRGILERRERLFAELGIDSIAGYRRLRATQASDSSGDAAARSDGDDHGDVFLVIDGWFTMHQEFEDLEPTVQDLASRGLGFGIHLIVTSSRWAEFRPWLRDALGTRFELRLGDPIDSAIGSRVAANVPQVPGRGLTPDGQHFLGALPRIGAGDAEDLTAATASVVEALDTEWLGPRATGVRTLPSVLPATELPPPSGGGERDRDLQVPLGLLEDDLSPLWHDFARSPHLMVFGDSETGKTNLLRTVAAAITRRFPADHARIILADYRRELTDEVGADHRLGYAVSSDVLQQCVTDAAVALAERAPGVDITPDRLPRRDWWVGPQLFVLVDDYDLVASGSQTPLQPLLDLLPMGADIGLHLVLARATAGASRSMMDPVLRRLWDLGTPAVMFSCGREEGTFLGSHRPRQLPAGRADYLTRRGARTIQTGLLADLGGPR